MIMGSIRRFSLILAILVCGLGAGDLGMPVDSVNVIVGNYSINWYMTPNQTIIIGVNQTGFGHFSIGYLPSMTNTDMTVVEINNGVVTANDYWSVTTKRPNLDTHNDVTLLASDTDGKSYVRVKYERPLNTGDAEDNVLQAGELRNFSLAFRSNPKLAFHGKNLLFFDGKLANSPPKDNSTPNSIAPVPHTQKPKVDSLMLAHGIVLTICWCLLADIALFVVTFRYRWWAVLVHAGLMLVAIAASLGLIFPVVKKKGGFSGWFELEIIQKAHFILAITVMSWSGLQIMTGIMTRLLQVFWVVHPGIIQIIGYFHKVLGYLMVLLGKVTCLVGWWMFNKIAFWIVLGWCILLTLLYLFRWTLISKLTSMSHSFRGYPHYDPTFQKSVLNAQLIQAYPPNAMELRKFNYVVFGDYVWDLNRKLWVHPGGNRLIKLVRGREIDRFIYGMYTEETTTNLNPVEHSKNSMMAPGNPLFRISQTPVYKGMPSVGSYYVNSIECYTKNNFILYLKSAEHELTFIPQTSISFIGHYYTISAFGITRLYTTIHSMNKNNRFYIEKLFQTLGIVLAGTQQVYHREALSMGGQEAVNTERNLIKMSAMPGNGTNQLPLMMKKYDAGKLTQQLFSKYRNCHLNVSTPMGRGLCLDKIRKGRVVIIVGGTGIYPFVDLIDLLFKFTVLQKQLAPPNDILALSPSITNPAVLAGFQFVLFAAFNKLTDLYVLQLLMLEFIAKENPALLRVIFKTNDTNLNPAQHPAITFIKDKFDASMIQRAKVLDERTSMVYICGPPSMNRAMLEAMKELKVDPSLYFIV